MCGFLLNAILQKFKECTFKSYTYSVFHTIYSSLAKYVALKK